MMKGIYQTAILMVCSLIALTAFAENPPDAIQQLQNMIKQVQKDSFDQVKALQDQVTKNSANDTQQLQKQIVQVQQEGLNNIAIVQKQIKQVNDNLMAQINKLQSEIQELSNRIH